LLGAALIVTVAMALLGGYTIVTQVPSLFAAG
jgi:hypothetical protein